jgi:hypothetical protein
MGYLELDLTLSDEAKAMQETVKKFAMEVMRPVGIKLDKMDPEAVIAKDSPSGTSSGPPGSWGYTKGGSPRPLGACWKIWIPRPVRSWLR